MSSVFDPAHLDVLAFARAGALLQGQTPAAAWPRLCEQGPLALTQDPPPLVSWRLQGRVKAEAGGAEQVWLSVQAEVSWPMTCQRCLAPAQLPVAVDRSLRFVADEETAARLDEELEEDVLVWSRDLDALALIEDELLLEWPLVPRHDQCPEPLPAPTDELPPEAEEPHPFAALAQLKRS